MINPQPTTTGFYTPPSKVEGANHTGQPRLASNQIKRAKKITKYILMGLVMLVLIGGGIAGYLLSQKPQDVRQQASTGDREPQPTDLSCSLTFNVPQPGCNDNCVSDDQCQDELKCLPPNGVNRFCRNLNNPTNAVDCADPTCPCISITRATPASLELDENKYQVELIWNHPVDDQLRYYRILRSFGAEASQVVTRTSASHWIDTNNDDGFTCGQILRYNILIDDSNEAVTCINSSSCVDPIEVTVPNCPIPPSPTPIPTVPASCPVTDCQITNLTAVPNPQHPDRQLDVTWQVVGAPVTSNKSNYQIHYAVKIASNEHFSSGSWHVLNGAQFTVGGNPSQVNKTTMTQISTDNPLLPNTEYLVDVTCKKSTVAPAVYCHDSSQTISTQSTTPESTVAPLPPTATPTTTPTGTLTPTATLPPGAPTNTPTPTFACDSPCETDGDCQTVNSEYICAADYDNKCRLDANRGSSTCEARSNTYVCNSHCDTTDECRTANSNYKCSTAYGNVCRLAANEGASNCQPVNYVAGESSVAPLAGCNVTCQSNANCAYTNYICYSTSSGNVCRLDQYPNSANCQPPAVVNAYVPAPQQVYIPPQQIAYVQQNPAVYSPVIPAVIPTPAPRADYTPYTPPTAEVQPELPAELYQTGPADWANWLKAGLVTLGLGAALLLLL